ncbi:hypothetical protein niasHT_034159 [Heterodera trifolii]|uniref:ShKT domain-containing protein n=1 Tax=Heterodera trifolii TaxID=157864 RepID=A0ABD2IFS4_9BILA
MSYNSFEHKYRVLRKEYYQLKINMTKLEIQYMQLKRMCDRHMNNCPCPETTTTTTSTAMTTTSMSTTTTTEQCEPAQPCQDDIPMICAHYAKLNQCNKPGAFGDKMRSKCKKSCSQC